MTERRRLMQSPELKTTTRALPPPANNVVATSQLTLLTSVGKPLLREFIIHILLLSNNNE